MQPLARHDIVIGQPLPFSVFDGEGKLLLAQGQVVRSETQLETLCENGFYPNPRWMAVPEPEPEKTPTDDLLLSLQRRQTMQRRQSKQRQHDPSADWMVRLRLDGFPDTYPVRLLGHMPGSSMLVTAPRDQGKLLSVREGQVICGKGFFGQTIYSFAGSIQKVCFTPFPYLHLCWDEGRLEKTTVRNSRRVSAMIEANLILLLPEGEQSQSVVINDISTGGAEITVTDSVAGKVRLEFELPVAGVTLQFKLSGSIRKRKDPGQKTDSARFGLAFDPIPEHQKIALHAWIHERLVERYECPLVST
jgi:hypothetical protein